MRISYGRQSISDADVDAVVRVLRSDFLTQGPAVPAFEAAVASTVGARHAVACNSATSALHIACLALDVGPGDRVWTSPNSFVASANCARYCGAEVDFVDIDPLTYNISTEILSAKLEQADRDGRLPKVLIPVHFAGQSCDMAEIGRLAAQYGIRIIEDASHAIGGTCRDKAVGGCAYSDIVVFSFHPVKIVTTAEGGMAVTNDPDLARRLTDLRSHGITRDPARLQRSDEGAWYYEQQSLGFNYRLTDIQAALGVSQMERLAQWVPARNALAARYDAALGHLPLRLPHVATDVLSAFHLYVVQIGDAKVDRRTVFDALRQRGIGVNVHYIPIHLQPDYAALGFAPGQFPNAEAYYARAISLPMHVELSDDDFEFVVQSLEEILR